MAAQMKSITKVILSALLMGALAAALYLYLLRSYETRISITGGEKPTFHFSGSGELVEFVIMGPRQRPGRPGAERDSFVVWELRPIDASSVAESVGAIGIIEYGIVPKGYKQIYPENGAHPPPIQLGEHYLLQAFTNEAPWGQLAFELREGKAIELPIK